MIRPYGRPSVILQFRREAAEVSRRLLLYYIVDFHSDFLNGFDPAVDTRKLARDFYNPALETMLYYGSGIPGVDARMSLVEMRDVVRGR